MLRRLLGGRRAKKKRLSPSARTAEGIRTGHPMFQYAVNEFAQTVPPTPENADVENTAYEEEDPGNGFVGQELQDRGPQGDVGVVDSGDTEGDFQTPTMNRFRMPDEQPIGLSISHSESFLSQATLMQQARQERNFPRRRLVSEPAMPDATYEEVYGEAYIGGPIRYVYPSGYQSMRPRGGPWKLSMVICLSFTWLSIFVIGHCSDQVDESLDGNEQIDDDTLAIETRWCGSRLLYMMWVISMLITGLATAYCSVIGYIKVRDFAVANARSQPPGMVGKSDYYVNIGESPSFAGSESSQKTSAGYTRSIYQSDGNPQFWGGHIYRPTQAAVAITSR